MRLLLLVLLGCDGDTKLSTYDSEPTASLTSPVSGASFDEGVPVEFVGEAHDNETDLAALEVSLSSNLQGVLAEHITLASGGVLDYPIGGLQEGNHTITLTVVDDHAQKVQDSVAITIVAVPEAPSVTVFHPVTGETARDDEAFTFVVQLADATDALDTLTMDVTSDKGGSLCTATADGAGLASCGATLTAGTHYLTFTATDPGGLAGTAGAGLVVYDHEDLDDDGDGWTENQGDCNDEVDTIHPGAIETFDGVDQDCDGRVDNGTPNYDDDGDGFTEVDGDCDDADATSFPGGVEVIDGNDNDCDGVLENDTDVYDDDGDGSSEAEGDCDDTEAAVRPFASELEDGLDNDCDGIIDEGTNAYDDDGDGYSENAGDCDDTDVAAYPGAPEDTSDTVDQDCDGIAQLDADGDGFLSLATGGDDCDDTDDATFPGASYNEADPTLCTTDADADGWGDDAPVAGVDAGSDCNDGNPAVNPDATENTSDYVDDDCDGTAQLDLDRDGYVSTGTGGTDCDDSDNDTFPGVATNEASPTLCRTDGDGDGYGDDGPAAGVSAGTDCDDGDATINPAATEDCDGADNDCDGSVDEVNATGCTTYYYDYDGDSYGSMTVAGQCLCSPSGYYTSSYRTDCYDSNSLANPTATTYYTTDRGDSSYDYNCNTTQDKKYPDAGACDGWPFCTLTSGWSGTVKSCGSSGSYYTGCSLSSSYLSCTGSTSTKTQSCR